MTILFGALPSRAFGDASLTSLELRALGAIAQHDRMSLLKGTVGCWAANVTLARICGCRPDSISRAIGALAAKGYLWVARRPGTNSRSLQVIYEPVEGGDLRTNTLAQSANYVGAERVQGTESTAISPPEYIENKTTKKPSARTGSVFQGLPTSAGDDLTQKPQERLAVLEALVQSGRPLDAGSVQFLDEVMRSEDRGSTIYRQARKIWAGGILNQNGLK